MTRRDVFVLLVEDDEDDYLITSELLEEDDDHFELEWVRDRKSAIDAVDRRHHDVCLLDFRLGSSTGLEIAVDLLERRADLPIIMLTGQDDDGIDEAAARVGVGDYLVKQRIDVQTLSRAIRYALQRRDSIAALRASEERYALALEGANDALWDLTVADGVLYRSPRWATILGRPPGWELREDADLLTDVVAEDRDLVRRRIDEHLAGRSPMLASEHRMEHAEGEERWVLLRGVARRDPSGRVTRIAGSLTDVTERKRAEQRLAHDARHDPLTGLANRPLLLERLEAAVRRVRRDPALDAAVLYLDLDRFKVVNDGLGHEVGDELLVAVGARIAACARPGDLVARLGGDEFVVLLDGPDALAAAQQVASWILEALRPTFHTNGHLVAATASIGIAACDGSVEPGAMLRDADTAMYRAKAAGGDRSALFDAPMHQAALERVGVESALRSAIARDEVRMHFQPLVGLADGRITGFEALARWSTPDGPMSPAVFIPVAEETGLVVELGRQALLTACSQLASWRTVGLVTSSATMSVNVSARQLLVGDLVEDVQTALRRSGLPGSCLRLELTESVFLDRPEVAFARLESALIPLGVGIHIDDFGTGYSSLSVLHRFPAEALKIDRSFISEMTTNHSAQRIVDAIVSLAHSLGRTLVAEGIETHEQLLAIWDRGCQVGQGWLFAPALPTAEVEELLRSAEPPWRRRLWGTAHDTSGPLRAPAA